ncbi:Cytochrome c oxidase assembly protein COX16, mitochondrial [Orchesella cincta]|uniref:Cytochrome c oxidase assembly protein COX16 homolog, mitochondrial n=1 Tax=Orchesella cincta TaxID=48709 RepID=A0A1D2NFH1_ORCCI|nr:Cytochrome c oxidase assembly protein COX16, mitochondrial [Orchesella cincta]
MIGGRLGRLFPKNRLLNFTVPFFVLVIGGSFGMTYFSKIRYEHRGQKTLTPEEAQDFGVKMKKPKEVNLENQFQRLQEMDIDTWENKRGPRPWEPDNPTNLELQERAKAKLSQ